jgi:hypothetical protein
MSEHQSSINWIKTQDRTPNPADNPSIIVAIPQSSSSMGIPNDLTRFTYVLCKGGKLVEGAWSDDEERDSLGRTHWFLHTDDVIAADGFQYWSDFGPEKIPWVDRSDKPVLFACPTTDESLYSPFTFPDFASFLVLLSPDDWTGYGDVDLFTTALFGGEFALDVLYAVENPEGDGLLCTNWLGKEVNLSVSHFVAIPDPKN